MSILTCLLRNCENSLEGELKGFAVHPSLDLALCIAVPEGHGLGGMRQFLGSHEGGSREGREERNAREADRKEMLARAPA